MKKQVCLYVTVLCLVWFLTPSAFTAEEKGKMDVFELGEVLITAKGGKVDLATTVTAITNDEIKKMGAVNVAETLDMLPGIDVQVGGKGQSQVSIRGFVQDDIKVLIDGVPAHEAYFGFLDLAQIPIDAIAKIEITKGASSVLYGANTMGGVINIITKRGGKEPFTSFTTSFGENDTQNYIFNHGASFGKFNYWLTYGYRSTDGFELSDDFDPNNDRTGIGSDYNEDGGMRDLGYYTKRSLNAKIGYEYDKDSKLYLSYDYHNNERGVPTEYSRYWAFTRWDQWHLNLVGEHDVTDLLTMKGRVFYVNHEDTLRDVGGWDDDHVTGKKWFETSAYDDYSTGGELHAYLDFGSMSLLKLGASYLKDNHKQTDYYDDTTLNVTRFGDSPGYQPTEEYEADSYTFAVEDEMTLVEKLSVVAGVSYDVFDPKKAYDQPTPDSIHTFNPQIGAVYDISDDFSIHASIGKKTRFPQLKELYSDYAGGNPDLDPQRTIAYEVGAAKAFNEMVKASVAFFYNDIEDLIDQNDDDVYVNVAQRDIQGLEIDLGFKTPFGLNAGMNYTYLSAEDKPSDGSPTVDSEYTPEHKFNLDLDYAFDFGLALFLQLSYTGEQYEYDRDDNKITLDDFTIINAKLIQHIYKFGKLDSEFFAEVKNLTDENYDEGSGPLPGISWLVGMNFTF